MPCEPADKPAPEPRRYRGPQDLDEEAARALEQGDGSGEGLGAMEEESVLQRWAEETGRLIPLAELSALPLVSNQSSEHEVWFREADQRAVKRTWPGMFGLVPARDSSGWMPKAAKPSEYLLRQANVTTRWGETGGIKEILVNQPSNHPTRKQKRPAEAGRRAGDAIPGGAARETTTGGAGLQANLP